MSDALVLKNSEETLYSGYLVKGEERKQGTQVAFKDKKRYFVLRCVGQKLLTMTAYKDEKDYLNFGRKGKVVNPDRFIETYNARVKVHKVQMAVKKHRTADILCIVQDKRPLYLEATGRAECEAWYNAFNTILIQLGWKEGSLDEQRPVSYPQTNEKSSTDQVYEDRHSTPSVMEGAFGDEPDRPHNRVIDGGYIGFKGTHNAESRLHAQPTECNEGPPSRLPPSPPSSPPSSPPAPSTPPKSPSILANSRHDNNRRSVPIGHSPDSAHDEDDCMFCCQRHHLEGNECDYGNIHNVSNVREWRKSVSIRRERLVNVRGFYDEYVGPPPPVEALKQARISAERRRSRSTSDIPLELKNLQERYACGHSLWEAPEEVTPPKLPERGLSSQSSPKPRVQRRKGVFVPPHNLDFPIAPPQDLNQPPLSPPMSPMVQQFLNKHHLPPYQQKERERKISAPTSPPTNPTYINAPNYSDHPPPSAPLQRKKHGSMIDVSRRPLPSPGERPSSFVQTLQWEQELHDGLPIAVPKKDLDETLALVKIADYVWIAGKKRGCPDTITSRFHVGDQLRQINEQIVVDVNIAHALFKTTAKEEVTLIVRRLPYAKMFTVKRTSADVGWGLKVEANKVMDVPKSGPAADAGIRPRPEGALSKRLCSWIVTQINNTPVSLSCSRDEVKNRLDNTDMEMSIILQPEDFINKLKTQLQDVKYSINYI